MHHADSNPLAHDHNFLSASHDAHERRTRYVVAFPGNGVTERLVIDAKARRITVVDRRGLLGTSPGS